MVQQGTRWNPGLSDEQIADYEVALGVHFPHDFKAFLREMNGTDLPTLNVYGYCGEPHRHSVGVYSYPRDLELIKERIEHISASRAEIASDLSEQGFELLPEAKQCLSLHIDTSFARQILTTALFCQSLSTTLTQSYMRTR